MKNMLVFGWIATSWSLMALAAPTELPLSSEPSGLRWIWSAGKATPQAFFEREFVVLTPPVGAQLRVSCDNGCTVFLNGKQAGKNPDWNRPTSAEVKEFVVSGVNKIRVEATNEGSAAGLLLSLELAFPDGSKRRLETDGSWLASAKLDVPLAAAQELQAYGGGPWGKVFDRGFNAAAAGAAPGPVCPPESIRVPAGFKVELLHELTKEEGSWVAMCLDGQGRLIASNSNGKLVRVTPPPVGGDLKTMRMETIDLEVGSANGLLWAFNSLYVMVCKEGVYEAGSGVYRVTDSNGDDQFDKVELLRKIHGQGDHGPHALLLTPGGKSITVVCGNATRLTEMQHYQVPPIWKDDLALPKLTGHGFMLKSGAPAGYIARMTPDGKEWTLVSTGLRNQYDAAFNRDGELFTYDADMEWDLGMPWYRPTRVCHLVDGADFGWRSVSGKWPEDYADSLPAAVNIGRGCPTGVVFGYGAKMPARYQNALFLSDWTYGKLYAVHLREDGASYTGDFEVFAEGKPLPLTDLVINPKDGALYFAVGTRTGGSALYRISYAGSESTEPKAEVSDPEASKLRALRHHLEDAYHSDDEDSLNLALQNLEHRDRFIRCAARTLLEFRVPGKWAARALELKSPRAVIQTALALARLEQLTYKKAAIENLAAMELGRLDAGTRLDWIRALQVVSVRLGDPEGPVLERLLDKLHALVPAPEQRVNVEASQLLVRWKSPRAAEKIVPLFAKAGSQEEQLSFGACLRLIPGPWPEGSKEKYFRWFLREDFNKPGHLGKFIADIRKDAVASLDEAEKLALKSVLEAPPEARPAPPVASRLFVKNWTTEELTSRVQMLLKENGKRDLERGKSLFRETGCVACHAFQGDGGAVGPELTLLGGRFSLREIVESLVEPSKVISDQYGTVNVTLKNGQTHMGRLVNDGPDLVQIQENLFAPSDVRDFARREVAKVEASPVSLMPPGLMNTCQPEEVADLVAWLLSGIK